MNDEELKIRKWWLVGLVLLTSLTLVHQVIAFVFDPQLKQTGYVSLLFICGTMLAFVYWFFHSAYMKRGTKFLTFFLIVSPISLLSSAVIYLLNLVPYKNYFPLYWVLTGASFVMGVVMFGLNWKMRKINANYKKA